MTYKTARTKQHDAQQQAHHGYNAQKQHGSVGMHNVANGGAANDEQRQRPRIIRQVFYADDVFM